MSSQDVYLTRGGYEKLRAELKYLRTVRRREISKEIGEAIAHGDISDNAEYDAAKEAQGLNETKIAELEDKLSRVRIIDDENIDLCQRTYQTRETARYPKIHRVHNN